MKRTALRSRKPLVRRRPPRTRSTLDQGSPPRKRNPKRRAKRRLEQFGPPGYVSWLLARPCCTCGKKATDPSHAAKTRGAGGKWWHMVPQCRACHDRLHVEGIDSAFPEWDREKFADAAAMYAVRAGRTEVLPIEFRAVLREIL